VNQAAAPTAAATSALAVGTASYLFASVFWGMNIPFTAVMFKTFDPFFLAPLRVALATVVLGSIIAATIGWRAFSVPMPLARFAAMTFAMASFFILYNLGLRYTNPITAAALMAGSPVYTAITVRLVTGAPLERGFWGAATLTVLGAAIAIYGRSSATAQGLSLQGGEPLIVMSLVSWTLYSIYAQRWFDPKVPQLRRTYVSTLGTTVWLTICWALAHATGLVGPPNLAPGPQAVVFLLATAIFATALGGVAWNIGVNRIGVVAGALWQNTVPVFGVLIAIPFGFIPTAQQIVGGVVVLSGVLYMQWRKLQYARLL
jgi:drug/metabolite transporter (DMT)-like permease